MEPIPSRESFGQAHANLGEAPVHTVAGHEYCAYYFHNGAVVCPHGTAPDGAFYSEDFVNQLRRESHQLIALLDAVLDKAKRMEEFPFAASYHFSDISASQFYNIQAAVNKFRELTK